MMMMMMVMMMVMFHLAEHVDKDGGDKDPSPEAKNKSYEISRFVNLF